MVRLRHIAPLMAGLLALTPPCSAQEPSNPKAIRLVEIESGLLSRFFGRPIEMRAGVVVPPDRKPEEKLPVCIGIHGFGGSHEKAWTEGARLVEWMKTGRYPRMIYVYPDARCPFGHHLFADSVNNGPWGKALVEELIPHVERELDAVAAPRGRFLTGHSSGGWSSLWLLVNYPDFFGGAWATAPDSVDFRDVGGIDLYSFKSIFVDPSGAEIDFLRQGGRFVQTMRQFIRGGQAEIMSRSIEAAYSPRGDDGRPMRMFDRKTGAIDAAVAKSWGRFDIGARVRREWATLGPKLAGKIRVYVGAQDNFRLEGAVRLFGRELAKRGSDARVLVVEGRDHSNLFRPHEEHWPRGLLVHIHEEMATRFAKSR